MADLDLDQDKQSSFSIDKLGIYKAAIPISVGFTLIASIATISNLGLFDVNVVHPSDDWFAITTMFFSNMAIFSVFILIVFLNLNKVVKIKENEIEEKSEYLIKAERLSAIGEVSARVAHDIRNPLSTLKNAIDLMCYKNKGDTIQISKKELAILKRATSRMTHQVEDVLDYVRGSSMEFTYSNLNDLILSAVNSLNNSKNVKITYPTNRVSINCDPLQLERVFVNIVLNAFQAVEKNGELKIRIKEYDKNVDIEFEDSGPGISEEIHSKIMDPLFTTKQQGTGLGLASCNRIIKNHGGRMVFKNRPTVFTVSLPKNKGI